MKFTRHPKNRWRLILGRVADPDFTGVIRMSLVYSVLLGLLWGIPLGYSQEGPSGIWVGAIVGPLVSLPTVLLLFALWKSFVRWDNQVDSENGSDKVRERKREQKSCQ